MKATPRRNYFHRSLNVILSSITALVLWTRLSSNFLKSASRSLGHGEQFCFKVLTNQLALDSDSGKIRLRLFVTDQVCIRRLLLIRLTLWRRFCCFHANSIRLLDWIWKFVVKPVSGRSVVWLARLLRVQEVVSSNLTAPTIFIGKNEVLTKIYP